MADLLHEATPITYANVHGSDLRGICTFLVKIALIWEPGAHDDVLNALLREPSNTASHYVVIIMTMVHYQFNLAHNSDTVPYTI